MLRYNERMVFTWEGSMLRSHTPHTHTHDVYEKNEVHIQARTAKLMFVAVQKRERGKKLSNILSHFIRHTGQPYFLQCTMPNDYIL